MGADLTKCFRVNSIVVERHSFTSNDGTHPIPTFEDPVVFEIIDL